MTLNNQQPVATAVATLAPPADGAAPPGGVALGRSWLSCPALGCFLALMSLAVPAGEPTENEVFRIAVTQASFGTVNRNDASAALKVWASTVARERALPVDVQVEVTTDLAELRKVLDRGTVHAVSLTSTEFVDSGEQPDFIYLSAKQAGYTEQYVVVVRGDTDIQDLRALKGRRLAHYQGPATSLALPWLETMLAQQQLGRAGEFLGEVSVLDNPSKPALRVFFRQSDACLTTTNAFALACELNPQLSRQLKVLAVSPPLIPGLFFFRKNYASPQLGEFMEAIQELHKTTIGQQVLTVFQTSRMEKHPVSCLDTTRQLLARYGQLNSQGNANPQPKRVAAAASAP